MIKNASKAGKSIVQTIRLSGGMNLITITRKIRICEKHTEAKKWGFVPDYARLDIVYEHGGIYLDTDVELVKNIDELLENKAYMGFEVGGEVVNQGLGYGAEKNFPLIKKMMEEIYGDRKFKLGEGNYDTTPSPTLNVECLLKHGFET